MRVLIDECLPRRLKNHLSDHDCRTVPEAGLAGKRNGELLSLAEQQEYEIFVTMDKGMEYQQNLRGRGLAVIILRAKSNQLADLLPYVSDCLERMKSIKPGEVVRVGSS
jgi:predicted nuclease of predicted toxin-antitoxin system